MTGASNAAEVSINERRGKLDLCRDEWRKGQLCSWTETQIGPDALRQTESLGALCGIFAERRRHRAWDSYANSQAALQMTE